MVRLSETEAEIEKAFKKTVKDYKKGMIGIEEDFRACLYHHMRRFCDSKGLLMLLSYNAGSKDEIVRPDISIFRGKRDFVVIEMKNERSYIVDGDLDIKKLQWYQNQNNHLRGYFIHIDQKDTRYKKRHRYAEWKDNYFVDLWYVIDTDTSHKFEVKRGITKETKL